MTDTTNDNATEVLVARLRNQIRNWQICEEAADALTPTASDAAQQGES